MARAVPTRDYPDSLRLRARQRLCKNPGRKCRDSDGRSARGAPRNNDGPVGARHAASRGNSSSIVVTGRSERDQCGRCDSRSIRIDRTRSAAYRRAAWRRRSAKLGRRRGAGVVISASSAEGGSSAGGRPWCSQDSACDNPGSTRVERAVQIMLKTFRFTVTDPIWFAAPVPAAVTSLSAAIKLLPAGVAAISVRFLKGNYAYGTRFRGRTGRFAAGTSRPPK